jgi:hypothetical protein
MNAARTGMMETDCLGYGHLFPEPSCTAEISPWAETVPELASIKMVFLALRIYLPRAIAQIGAVLAHNPA